MRRIPGFLAALAVAALVLAAPWIRMPAMAKTAPFGGTHHFVAPDNTIVSADLAPAIVKAPHAVSSPGSPARRSRGLSSGARIASPAISITLPAGACATESTSVRIDSCGGPQALDLVFCMDLTGSMSGELAQVKISSNSIMNLIRSSLVADSQFGLMSHMDYVGDFTGCGYSDTYGDSSYHDYPYRLGQPVTGVLNDVTTAINALGLGNGIDGPEDYTRPLFESYSDANVGWRPGSKRILMSWGDAYPHDCAFDAIVGGSSSSGPDPGRDGIAGNSDDLAILPVLDGMKASNVTLVALHSGGSLPLWKAYAKRTGGDAFQINPDGTIPGGENIAQFVAGLVETTFCNLRELKLAVADTTYRSWLASPTVYRDIALNRGQDFGFGYRLCVPAGTPTGNYCFDIQAVGDGATYATQRVCVTVADTSSHITACPKSAEYWTEHRSSWPASLLPLGNHSYNPIALERLLGEERGGRHEREGDLTTLRLARQLIAAKFNILAGAAGPGTGSLVAQADALIGDHRVPFEIHCGHHDGGDRSAATPADAGASGASANCHDGNDCTRLIRQIEQVSAELEKFNGGRLTPDCHDGDHHGDDPGDDEHGDGHDSHGDGDGHGSDRGGRKDALSPASDGLAGPLEFSVQTQPNPFRGSTTIAYSLPVAGEVRIALYDLQGREVRVLVDGAMSAGRHLVPWDGTDTAGQKLKSGVYFYRVIAGPYTSDRKLVIQQ